MFFEKINENTKELYIASCFRTATDLGLPSDIVKVTENNIEIDITNIDIQNKKRPKKNKILLSRLLDVVCPFTSTFKKNFVKIKDKTNKIYYKNLIEPILNQIVRAEIIQSIDNAFILEIHDIVFPNKEEKIKGILFDKRKKNSIKHKKNDVIYCLASKILAHKDKDFVLLDRQSNDFLKKMLEYVMKQSNYSLENLYIHKIYRQTRSARIIFVILYDNQNFYKNFNLSKKLSAELKCKTEVITYSEDKMQLLDNLLHPIIARKKEIDENNVIKLFIQAGDFLHVIGKSGENVRMLSFILQQSISLVKDTTNILDTTTY